MTLRKALLNVESFGGIDADADELLEESFEDHEAYSNALAHRRFLVIGRKGSGKTAIFRKIVGVSRWNYFALGHTFDDYPWAHHDLQAAGGVPEESRYTNSWKYLILLTLSKTVLNDDQSQPWDEGCFDDLGRIESFVVDSYGTKNPDVTQIFSPKKRLNLKGMLGLSGSGLTGGVNVEQLPMIDLPRFVQELNRNISDAVIRLLNPDFDYHICFDQLDLGFSPSTANYSARLTGLILAARDLNLQARSMRKRFSVSVFLRDDIYELLRFEDKNKISENFVSRIEWDTPRTKHTLRALMERRLRVVLAGTNLPTNGVWEAVFDETQEMPGRQSKYQHILDRTFRRPRDMIKFSNEILRAFKDEVWEGEGSPIRNHHIHRARGTYSDYLLHELDDEVFKHIPSYSNYLELIKLIGGTQFSYASFEEICGNRPELVSGVEPVRRILRELFEFSIVGFYRAGGGGGGSGYVWRYLESRERFDEGATTFRVHPGLKEALGLKLGQQD